MCKVWKGKKYIMITLPNGYSEPYHKYVINKKLNVPNGWSIHHLKSKNNNKFQNLLPLPNDVHIGVTILILIDGFLQLI